MEGDGGACGAGEREGERGVGISKARQLRKNPTKAESTLWRHLRGRRLEGYKFRRQVPLGRYIVDFVSFERRLIIELDGGHHQVQAAYDNQRTQWLESQGFRVLRFWNNQVLGQTEAIAQAILEALEHHPSPSPVEAEGEDPPSGRGPG